MKTIWQTYWGWVQMTGIKVLDILFSLIKTVGRIIGAYPHYYKGLSKYLV